MTYNIRIKDMDDKRGRWKKGRNHRDWSEADAFIASIYYEMQPGEVHRIAYEIENIYSGITIPWVEGVFHLQKDAYTRYEYGSFAEWVLAYQWADVADLIERIVQ